MKTAEDLRARRLLIANMRRLQAQTFDVGDELNYQASGCIFMKEHSDYLVEMSLFLTTLADDLADDLGAAEELHQQTGKGQ